MGGVLNVKLVTGIHGRQVETRRALREERVGHHPWDLLFPQRHLIQALPLMLVKGNGRHLLVVHRPAGPNGQHQRIGGRASMEARAMPSVTRRYVHGVAFRCNYTHSFLSLRVRVRLAVHPVARVHHRIQLPQPPLSTLRIPRLVHLHLEALSPGPIHALNPTPCHQAT